MKKASTKVEEIFIKGFPLKRNQKRLITRFICECKEEDIYYRPADHAEMMMNEYTKPVKK
ncbi:MAG: hypothetical protein KGL95_11000 [Patescibacteria group bacterium]|nr:hypothetical protein [Patescibacteria group bacterium]